MLFLPKKNCIHVRTHCRKALTHAGITKVNSFKCYSPFIVEQKTGLFTGYIGQPVLGYTDYLGNMSPVPRVYPAILTGKANYRGITAS